MNRKKLVLASSSPYRAELLARLKLPFEQVDPSVNESPRHNESPTELVMRLALDKAWALIDKYPEALIIGSDQLAVLDEQVLGKPGNHINAVNQLKSISGRTVKFLTSLCLLNAQTQKYQHNMVACSISFRELTADQIEHYVQLEKPYNCAGSFKSEGLGVALFACQEGEDPTALIGLPLISLVSMLQNEGHTVL